MNVLDRKLGRDIRAFGGTLLAVAGIITVGVSCFVAMGSAYNNLSAAKSRFYQQCRMADFWIDVKKVPEPELEALAGLRGIAALRSRIQFNATVALDRVREPLNGMVLSLPDRRKPVINDVVVRQGSYFTGRRENEVIVNEAFAEAHDLAPGDWIHLVLNDRRQELFIVGTAISSEFVYLLGPGAVTPDPDHFGVFYVKRNYAEDVFDFAGAANSIVGRLSPEARRNPQPILRRAERMLDAYGVFATTPLEDQASNMYLSQEIQGLQSFAYFMPAIFLAVAALVLNVQLTRLADQQRTVVGTLKALGYSNRQVFLHFLKFGLTVGLLGGLIGCGVGYWLAHGMTVMYRQFFIFPELDNRFYPGLQTTGLTISVICAVLGSLNGARMVLKLEPAAAMRPKPPRKGGAIVLEQITWLWSRLSSGWRMVVRSVVRNRLRTAVGLFAAAMGSAVMVAGFMMADAAHFMVDFQFKWILRSDFDLTFKDEHGRDALLEASRLPGVDLAEPQLNVACTFSRGPYRHKGAVTGLKPDARLTVPRDRQAQPVRIPATGVAMTRKLAEILHVKVGDQVTFKPVKGLRREHRVDVVEIVDSYLGTAVYADIGYLSRLIGEEYALNGVQLLVDGDPRQRQQLYRELKRLPALQSVTSRPDMVASLEETLVQNMWVFIGLLILFAGIMFFGSILNASLVSLAERQREVATLRVLGYGPWQIGGMMFRESMVVTMIGTLLGMPIGYLLAVGMAITYDTEMFRFPVVATTATWVWTVVLAVLFGVGAHLVVQRTIHKMNWLEALEAKE